MISCCRYIVHFINTHASSKGQYDITIYIYTPYHKTNSVECLHCDLLNVGFSSGRYTSFLCNIMYAWRSDYTQRPLYLKTIIFFHTRPHIGNVIVVITGSFRKTPLLRVLAYFRHQHPHPKPHPPPSPHLIMIIIIYLK